jgi:hypothetical protein
MSRVETGPVRIGDDWAGIFIRGDDAAGYVLALCNTMANPDDPDLDFTERLDAARVWQLCDLLQACAEPCEAVALKRASPPTQDEP